LSGFDFLNNEDIKKIEVDHRTSQHFQWRQHFLHTSLSSLFFNPSQDRKSEILTQRPL
jgi:hypothetical protein